MTAEEVVALIRLSLALIAFPFAVRARYWLLSGALAAGGVVSVLVSFGTSRLLTGTLAVALYGLLAAHALDISHQRRRRQRPRRD